MFRKEKQISCLTAAHPFDIFFWMMSSWPLGGEQAVAGSVPTDEQAAAICAFREALQSSEEFLAFAAEARPYVEDERRVEK